MKQWKKLAMGLVLVFIAIQFIRPVKNKGEVSAAIVIGNWQNVPRDVQLLLQNACYDCHSSNTKYPWYAEVQPLGWILSRHIKEGKRELNFDEFGDYSVKRQKSKLKAIASQVKDGQMPLRSYSWLHPEARLTQTEKKILIDWVDDIIH